MKEPLIQLFESKFTKGAGEHVSFSCDYERTIYALWRMSEDLTKAQERIASIPEIVKKHKIDRILLLWNGGRELEPVLRKAITTIPIEVFNDKSTKLQKDNEVDYSVRKPYAKQRILVIDEITHYWTWARNISRLAKKYLTPVYYFSLMSTGRYSVDNIKNELTSPMFVVDIPNYTKPRAFDLFSGMNFYTRELGAVLWGRYFNGEWKRSCIDYIYKISHDHLHDILIGKKRIDPDIFPTLVDDFEKSSLWEELCDEWNTKVFAEITMAYQTKKGDALIDLAYGYQDNLSNEQINKILDYMTDLYKTKPIDHYSRRKDIISFAQSVKVVSSKVPALLYLYWEFELADQYIARHKLWWFKNYSDYKKIFLGYIKKQIEEACENGRIKRAFDLQEKYFPGDRKLKKFIENTELTPNAKVKTKIEAEFEAGDFGELEWVSIWLLTRIIPKRWGSVV